MQCSIVILSIKICAVSELFYNTIIINICVIHLISNEMSPIILFKE